MTKIKLQIKNRWTGDLLFEYEKEDNTIRDTVEKAVEQRAYLGGAYLGGAYLGGADLRGADLGDAYLGGAYLGGAKNLPHIPMACPTDGAFEGWKKVYGHLVHLLIPADARRSSATSTKCRCDKAQVLDITSLDGSAHIDYITNHQYEPAITYKVGEIVLPDSFDEDRWNECSHGIHFFIDKQEAINY